MPHHTPSARDYEARHLLIDQLGDVLTQAHLVRDTGHDLSAPQRHALERLIEAAREAERQIGGGR